tara:strand:+ start:3678 stop:3827 length:150 start_codon:yes stop_codon:yes gene_type:complete
MNKKTVPANKKATLSPKTMQESSNIKDASVVKQVRSSIPDTGAYRKNSV